jgi:diketogulonate reductase-like aldo/keto reductase
VTDDPTVRSVATETGSTASQVGLSWQLAHAPNTMLIPGTADPL